MPDSTARKRALSYLATAALIGLVLVFTRRQWSEFANIRRMSLPAVAWLSVLFVGTAACNGYSLKLFAAAFGVRLRVSEWFGLECVRAFVNYLPLSAGLAYSAAYLKTKNNLPVTKYVSLSAGSTLLMLLGFGGWGTLLLAAQYAAGGELNIILLGVSLAFVAAGLGALLVPLPAAAPNRRLFKWIMSIRDGWALIRGNGPLLLKIVALQTLILTLLSLRFLIIFRELGYPLNVTGVVLLTIMTTLIRFSSLLPGNLGVREAIAGGVTASFGLTFSSGFLAGVIDRLVAMVWIFVLGIIFSVALANRPAGDNNHSTGRAA